MNNALNKSFQNLKKLDLDSLVRSELGPFSFEDHVEYYRKLQRFWFPIENHLDFYIDQSHQANLANGTFKKVIDTAELIKNFSEDIASPRAQHDTLLANLSQAFTESINGYGALRTHILEETEGGSEDEDEARQILKILKGREKESKVVLASMSEAAGRVGVEAHGQNFKKAARKHRIGSYIWLGVTGIIIVAYSLILFKLLELNELAILTPHENLKEFSHFTVQSILYRVTLITLGLIALYFTIKNFSAHRHLQTENEFRENALNTFRTFTDAAEGNESIKSAILLATTQAIFTIPNTGYLGKNSTQSVETPLINIAKIITRTSDKE